jgi:hypothetical protein
MITPEERIELTREITEHVLLLLPSVISHLINNMATMKELSTQFYEKHKDLAQHKNIVGTVIEQLEAKHPGKSVEEILNLAAPEARKLMSLQQNVESKPSFSVDKLDKILGNL